MTAAAPKLPKQPLAFPIPKGTCQRPRHYGRRIELLGYCGGSGLTQRRHVGCVPLAPGRSHTHGACVSPINPTSPAGHGTARCDLLVFPPPNSGVLVRTRRRRGWSSARGKNIRHVLLAFPTTTTMHGILGRRPAVHLSIYLSLRFFIPCGPYTSLSSYRSTQISKCT
jgi:hypothetical protein